MSGSVCDIHRFSVSGVICVVWPCVCYECVPSVCCAHVRCALCARCMWCISISLCPVWVVCARAMCSLRGTYVISLAPSVFGVSYVWHGIVVHVLCDLIGFP